MTATKTPPLAEVVHEEDGSSRLRWHFHPGQTRIWDSKARFVLASAGTQSGKTEFAPAWLHREIQASPPCEVEGHADYLVASATYDLLDLKVRPAMVRYFCNLTGWGDYHGGQRLIKSRNDESRIIFRSAQNPESLESLTGRAAVLDEFGQASVPVEAWEAVQRRLSINQGRALFVTTPYCYDEETEIYTRSGWMRFGDLDEDDEVFACDPSGHGDFEKPRKIVWQWYRGKMLHFRGARIDLMVTPNHRVLHHYHKKPYITTAEEFRALKRRSRTIPKVISPAWGDVEAFTLPSVGRGHLSDASELVIPMAQWCAFMGWFLSEGCTRGSNGGKIVNGNYRVSISQKNEDGRDILRRDLNELPFKWSEDKTGFHTVSKQLWTYLRQFGNGKQKWIPDEIKFAGKGNLEVFIDRMVLGDGTYRHDRYDEFVYYTISDRLAADFREVCMLAGISTHASQWEQPVSQIRGRPLHPTSSIWHISERKRKSGIAMQDEGVEYEGYIGCVAVSTGLVLVRRNGEECISGNTLGWLLQQVYNRWRAGDADYDVIQFPSTDNPTFPQDEFDRAKATLPEWKFRMFYCGEFVRPAGLIYGDYEDAYAPQAPETQWVDRRRWVEGVSGHLCKPFSIPEAWPRLVGVDPGGTEHTSLVWLAEHPEQGNYYAYREVLGGGMSGQEHARAALEYREPVRAWMGGATSEDSARETWGMAGVPLGKPIITEVEAGIDRVVALFRQHRLYIMEHMTGLRNELGTYSRELDAAGEPTLKIEHKERYHRLDALRGIASIINIDAPDPIYEVKSQTPRAAVVDEYDRKMREKRRRERDEVHGIDDAVTWAGD